MHNDTNSVTGTVEASPGRDIELPESIRRQMRRVPTFRAADGPNLPMTTNLIDLEYHLDPRKPFDVLPLTDASMEDETILEVMDPKLLCVKQTGEDGEPQVVVLTPAQLIYMMHKACAVICLPGGGPLVVE